MRSNIARRAFALALALCGVLLAGCALTAPFEGLEVGETGPELDIAAWLNVPGGVLRLSDVRGRPVLLQFWSMDDPATMRHLDTLRTIHERYARDLRLVSVHVDINKSSAPQDPGRVRAFLVREAITFPVGIDKRGVAYTTYQFTHLPHAVLLDEHGNVTWSGHLVTYDLEPAVKRMLEERRGRS
jgi:thiol-disulfide isomerase/thioredoxin